ncbi:hypothetical protein Tco_1128022 [Tanacetum coccineum]
MKNNLQKTVFESEVTKDLNHKNLFYNENSKKTNDEGRVSSYDDGTKLSLEFQKDDNSGVTSFNFESADLPINIVKRSSRHTKLPTSLNDFIIDDKVKYGVKRVVNYANLNSVNFCFAYSLNKSIEPTCYKNVILDSNWFDDMNAEIEALNKNHTLIITDLPANRKQMTSFPT